MTGGGSEPSIPRDQGRTKQLGQGDVCRIIRRHVDAQCPDAGQKRRVFVPSARQRREESKCLESTRFLKHATEGKSPTHLRDLDIEQKRRVKLFP